MALTGQLSDMSLAELIEFFCNQRKTGRLKIDYPRGHSVFFIKEGELVDAKVGSLNGPEAVYFSLTLPNAAFDFSPEVEPTRRTIRESWTQVVLEGLRRLDEGLSPTEQDAFGNFSPSESEMAAMFDQVERLGEQSKRNDERRERDEEGPTRAAESAAPPPLSLMVDSATAGRGGKKKWVALGVAASVVLACAVVGVPLLSRSPKPAAAATAAESPAAAAPEQLAASGASAPAEQPEAGPTPDAAAADAARREREERERRERRERERKEESKREAEAAKAAPAAAPVAAGPKSVRVSVSYDEAGRVTQASVAGATPGAEGYGSTAVRIARGRRFPAGKPGSAVVTIPVN